MTKLPSAYAHQVVANWIAANDDEAHPHVRSVVSTPQNISQVDVPSPFDYDVAARHARKMQAEAIHAVARPIRKSIGRVVSNSIRSLRDHFRTRRQIQRLSYLTPRLLDDMGIPHELQVRVRAQQAHREPYRFHALF